MFGFAFAGLVQFRVPAMRRQAAVACRAAIAVAMAGIIYFLFVGTRRWVFLNAYNARYTFPALFLFQEVFAIFGVGLLTPAIRDQLNRGIYVLAAVGLLLAGLINYDSPSVKHVHEDLTHTYGLGGRTADVLDARCTHVAGDYWNVWTTVFHANLMLHEQGQCGTIWGIAVPRGEATWAQWKHLPLEKLRIAVPIEDREKAETLLMAFHLPPMVVVEKRPTIYVLRPADVVLREQEQRSLMVRHQDSTIGALR